MLPAVVKKQHLSVRQFGPKLRPGVAALAFARPRGELMQANAKYLMTKSIPVATELERAAGRAPRHTVKRLVGPAAASSIHVALKKREAVSATGNFGNGLSGSYSPSICQGPLALGAE